jgi:ABC-type proline/glycine betaine transport system permease subunit
MSSNPEHIEAIIVGVIVGVLLGIPVLCIAVYNCSKGGELIMRKIDSMYQTHPSTETPMDELYDLESGDLSETNNPSH